MRILRQIVDKLVNGVFEYDCGKLTFSVPKIEASVPPGNLYEGSFTIKSVSDTLVKGFISASDIRITVKTDKFEEAECEVDFSFDSTGLEAGDVVKGDIRVVSSAGEYYLPFVFSIVHTIIESSLGNVRNLFHFTNQAQLNWDEAVHLFYSDEFKQVFDGNDRIHSQKYLGFLNAPRSEQSVDSFLVSINKKQKISYSFDRYTYEFKDVTDEMRCEVLLHKSTWGYVHVELSTDCDFIRLEKSTLSSNDFLGNEFCLIFYIIDSKLHEGNNYGRIHVKNPCKDIALTIIASKRKSSDSRRAEKREKKQLISKLVRKYVAFRLRKMNVSSWVRDSIKIVERLNALDDRNALSRLFQAQLLLVEERYNEANWILEHVDSEMNVHTLDHETYCYYLYLTALYRREEDYVNQVSTQIMSIYGQNQKSFLTLWMLLYLDEELSSNNAKKLAAIERQFEEGCNSPILYIEAYNCYLSSPSLLNKLTGFELQVLWFALKNKCFDKEVYDQLVYLAMKQHQIDKSLLKVLFAAYDFFPEKSLVEVICSVLIKDDRRENEYFIWYKRGVDLDLNITRLYEYYLFSASLDYREAFPKQIFMYFGFESNISYERKALLYANLIAHKKLYPDLYESYREQMLVFALDQIDEENVDGNLAEIYGDVLFAEMIRPKMALHLSKLIFANEIKNLEPDMVRLVVVQEQLCYEQYYDIVGGISYPSIYSDDSTLFAEDKEGVRYLVDSSKLRKLMNESLYIPMIKDYVSTNLPFMIFLAEGKRHYVVVDESNAELCRCLVDSDEIKEDYKRDIRLGLLHFYYDNEQISSLDEFLEVIDPKVLGPKDRAELINFYVRRDMFEEAYELMASYGAEEVSSKTCAKVCARMVEKKEHLPDTILVKLCYHAFKQGKYDSETLQYLAENYEGLTKELRDIWKAAGAFDLDIYSLTERLLIQMLFTRTTVGEKENIFESYMAQGASTKVELAYLSYSAFDYFAKERLTDDSVFEHLVDNYRLGEKLNDACKLALLKYYGEEKTEYSERIKDMLREFIKDYLHRNMYFKFFHEYVSIMPELATFEDKAIIEYRTNPGSKVVLHYILEEQDSSEETYVTEEMRNMFGGVFSREFILFFGENLQYYITEERGGKELLTVSDSVSVSDVATLDSESRYSLLNDMVVSRTLKDDDTLIKLMEEYVEADYFTAKLFTLL